ncbi:MAG: putative O-glycosylation ligase, exosortase A system-associated [Planctomycetota bacterium]
MRDLFVALLVLTALPISFKRPVVGILMFSLLAYMRVQDLAWGFARFERWSLYVALAMLAGYAAQREKHGPIWTFRTGLLLFMPVWTFLGLIVAIGAKAFQSANFVEYSKVIFIALFTTMVVRTRAHLRALMWVIGGSFAFFGLKNGAAAILSGGSLYIIRGPGGMLEDNNDFAMALAMSLPVIVGLATSEVNPYYQRWLKLFVPFTYMAIFATRSRGGFLAAGLATFILVWRSRNRVAGLMLMGLAGVIGLALLPPEMFERLKTLKDVQADGSAMGRLAAWKVAGEMIEDHPLFGVGFNQFQRRYLDYGVAVGTTSGTRVAHNGYLQIWSEAGTPVFLAYFTLLVLSVLAVQRIRREARRVFDRSWIFSYCTAFEGTILVFMLGSMFLNRAHFDLIYHYFAIVMVFERVAREEMRSPTVAARVRTGVGGGPLVRRESFGFGRRASPRRGFRRTSLTPRVLRGGGAGIADRTEGA